MATPQQIADAKSGVTGPYVPQDAGSFLDRFKFPKSGLDQEGLRRAEKQAGMSADQITDQRLNLDSAVGVDKYLNPYAATPDSVDQTQNYYGLSADNTRAIERVAAPGALSQNAFNVYGFQPMQSAGWDAITAARVAQRNAALSTGMGQQNAAQSRATALGALTAPGPSAGQAQALLGGEAAARNAMAMARSGRGYGSAGQLRSATFAGQDAMAQANQQAAVIRAQEEAQRRQQLLALGAQDLSALGQSYQQGLSSGALGLQALGQTGQLSLAQQQAIADREKTQAGMQFDANRLNAQFANYDKQEPVDNTWTDVGNAVGAAGGAAAGAAALFSDRDSKLDIRPTTLADKFENIGSHSYRYKDPTIPGTAPGRHSGPMADELRALGVTARDKATGWEKVDPGRLALANASATGELARRIKALEALGA